VVKDRTLARITRAVADLHPAYAGMVMAIGIVSTDFKRFGHRGLSDALLVIAVIVFVILLVSYGWRLLQFPRRVLDDLRDPSRTFGYFTLVAAANVVAVRMKLADDVTVTAALAIASVAVWLTLSYLIPLELAAHHRDPVMPGINGSWYLWTVGTQSIAEVTATLATALPARADWLATISVVFWSIGVLLYLIIAILVTARLLIVGLTPQVALPTYWISMGATAISVLAAAKILALPEHIRAVTVTQDVISGLGFMLWAFGSWWIPMLIVLGIWRHALRRHAVTYDPSWWGLVFPLGMYAAASDRFGQVKHLDFMTDIAQYGIWVALAALVGIGALALRRLGGRDDIQPG
jgi:tellurite resistance protein TehA-like permease